MQVLDSDFDSADSADESARGLRAAAVVVVRAKLAIARMLRRLEESILRVFIFFRFVEVCFRFVVFFFFRIGSCRFVLVLVGLVGFLFLDGEALV